jgi:hypothetical protein
VHVPAGTTLLQEDTCPAGVVVRDWTKTTIPTTLLVASRDDTYCSVVYQGCQWKALATDCYNQKEVSDCG